MVRRVGLRRGVDSNTHTHTHTHKVRAGSMRSPLENIRLSLPTYIFEPSVVIAVSTREVGFSRSTGKVSAIASSRAMAMFAAIS